MLQEKHNPQYYSELDRVLIKNNIQIPVLEWKYHHYQLNTKVLVK